MISRDSSGSVVKDTGVRYGGPWFELWSLLLLFIIIGGTGKEAKPVKT